MERRGAERRKTTENESICSASAKNIFHNVRAGGKWQAGEDAKLRKRTEVSDIWTEEKVNC